MSKGNADFSCQGKDNRDKSPALPTTKDGPPTKFKIPKGPGHPSQHRRTDHPSSMRPGTLKLDNAKIYEAISFL
jgi:hypothetical protein